MAHKPLIIHPKFIRPLPQSMWDVNCAKCDKRQSRWQFFPSDAPEGVKGGVLVCSLCWLYESDWGKNRREDLDQMIRDVETTAEEIFHKTKDGRLWSVRDADRILGAIALTSRMFIMRGRAEGANG